MEETKKRRAYYVRTKGKYTYKIIADYLEYDCDELEGKILYFKKHFEGQDNGNGSDIFIVAFFKAEDVEFVGLEGCIFIGTINV